jgi:hypothetical protein
MQPEPVSHLRPTASGTVQVEAMISRYLISSYYTKSQLYV